MQGNILTRTHSPAVANCLRARAIRHTLCIFVTAAAWPAARSSDRTLGIGAYLPHLQRRNARANSLKRHACEVRTANAQAIQRGHLVHGLAVKVVVVNCGVLDIVRMRSI